jgi:hypothetical protein
MYESKGHSDCKLSIRNQLILGVDLFYIFWSMLIFIVDLYD